MSEQKNKTFEFDYDSEAVKGAGKEAIETILENIEISIQSAVEYKIMPQDVVFDILKGIEKAEEQSFSGLEIKFLKTKGSFKKLVREYVYKRLPKAVAEYGEDEYGIAASVSLTDSSDIDTIGEIVGNVLIHVGNAFTVDEATHELADLCHKLSHALAVHYAKKEGDADA